MKCCPEVFKQSLHKHPLKSLMNMPLITTFSDITSSLHNLVTGGLSSIAFLIYTCTHTYNMNTYIHTYIYSQMHKIPTTTYMHTKTYIHTHVCMTLYVYMHVPKKCKIFHWLQQITFFTYIFIWIGFASIALMIYGVKTMENMKMLDYKKMQTTYRKRWNLWKKKK